MVLGCVQLPAVAAAQASAQSLTQPSLQSSAQASGAAPEAPDAPEALGAHLAQPSLSTLSVSPGSSVAMVSPGQDQLVGRVSEYEVQPGDYLIKIGARYGVAPPVLARDNGLRSAEHLQPGQKLQIDNRHIVPQVQIQMVPQVQGQNQPLSQPRNQPQNPPRTAALLINLPQRMLYFFRTPGMESQHQSELVAAYPVGLGKPSWPTPEGEFTVVNKSDNKTWVVPKSIQAEMRRKGQVVKTSVPPGPDNPLGNTWLGLSIPALGIHGTNAPPSVYHFQSHGCIRLHLDDILALFPQVPLGTPGRIIYSPLLMTESGGQVFLEVHPDIYRRGDVSMAALETLAQQKSLTERIDWAHAADVLKQQDGIARDVTRPRPTALPKIEMKEKSSNDKAFDG
jgi:L,D-transpeptidase ErfK/SrfK